MTVRALRSSPSRGDLEFPGKRRLRLRVALPTAGVHNVALLGARFRLDLSESLHRDYYFGLCDQVELRLIRRLLSAAATSSMSAHTSGCTPS